MTAVCFTDQELLEESIAECPCCGIVYGDNDESSNFVVLKVNTRRKSWKQ